MKLKEIAQLCETYNDSEDDYFTVTVSSRDGDVPDWVEDAISGFNVKDWHNKGSRASFKISWGGSGLFDALGDAVNDFDLQDRYDDEGDGESNMQRFGLRFSTD